MQGTGKPAAISTQLVSTDNRPEFILDLVKRSIHTRAILLKDKGELVNSLIIGQSNCKALISEILNKNFYEFLNDFENINAINLP